MLSMKKQPKEGTLEISCLGSADGALPSDNRVGFSLDNQTQSLSWGQLGRVLSLAPDDDHDVDPRHLQSRR